MAAIAAPGTADLEALSAAARPVVATRAELTVAVVFPVADTAQLMVFRGPTLEAKSAPFEFPLAANYGAAWVEIIDIASASRFTLYMRTRQTCGPGVYDYRFAQRKQTWVLSGLDRAESECAEAGIVPSSKVSYNFLTGTIVRTDFGRKSHAKVTTAHHAFSAFPLTSFEAFASRYEAE